MGNNPLDFVVFRHGLKQKIGIVIDIYDQDMVMFFNDNTSKIDLIPTNKLSITKTYRHVSYMSMFDVYLKQQALFTVYVNQTKELKKSLKGANKKTDTSISLIYVLTNSEIGYPDEYSTEKVTVEQFFKDNNGFREIF